MQNSSSVGGEHGSLTRHTVQGIFWITAGRLLKAPISLLAVAVLARLLTPADFGIVAIGTLVVSLSNVVVDGSFGMVLIQRRELDSKLIGASLALSSALALLMAVAVIGGAPAIEREFDFPQLSRVLLFLGALLPVTAVTTVTTALLQRSFKFGILTLNAFLSQVTYTTVSISLALAGFGLWSLVWAQLSCFVLEASLGFLAVRKEYRVQISIPALRQVLTSGGMFTVSKLLNLGANSVDRIVIGRLLGAASLGFYTRALNLMTTARDVSGAGPVRVLFSSFAKMQGNPVRLKKAYLRALSVSALVSTLFSAFVVVNADIIIWVLLGKRWLATVPLLQILFSAFVARTSYVCAEAVPLALGLSGQSALRQGAQLVLVLVGAWFGAPYGVIGATVGICAAYWIFYFLCLVLVRRLLDVAWVEVLRLHFMSLIAAAPPAAVAIVSRLLLSGSNPILQLIPAVLFAITAAIVLAVAPAGLVSDDVVTARQHMWERLSLYLLRAHSRILP